ncbi:ABC transporter substrate-binding protein [Alkalibacter mobilis]|uniref:ABC transporter substrate-binding protein n=1 Tax=Alkalibacter mobilis TaxID=2787712 RepID=UPI00189F5A93|nr:ABC transporter substrate-binding protein [Alkalibacter mobilis]MBF7095665.1 ABC transporter substrate-binding protein [Alkalibacter mobilis]
MKNKFTWFFMILILVALMVSGCAGEDTNASGSEGSDLVEPTTINIGMMSSSDVIPYVLINELKLYEDYDFKLNLEVFMSAIDRDAAFQAGELDGVLTDYIGVTMYQNADFDVKITGITDGDYILMAGKDTGIQSLDQLKDKSIAISQNTLIDYSLDYILTESGIDLDSIEREVVARIPDRLELLRNGQIDLGLMPEPFATLGLNSGAIYLKSANDVGLYPAVSAFSQKALDEKEAAIRQLYQAYNRAVEYMNSTPLSEYEAIVIEAVRYPEEMIGQVEIDEFRQSQLPDKDAVEKAIAWSIERGLTKSDLTYDDIVYDVYE